MGWVIVFPPRFFHSLCRANFCVLKSSKLTCSFLDRASASPSITSLPFSSCPCCAFSHNWQRLQNLRWKNSVFPSVSTACQRHLTEKWSPMPWKKRINEILYTFVSLLPLCCTLTCVVTHSSVLPGVSTGVSDLSPSVIWSSDFYWHVCAVWVTQVPMLSRSRWTCMSHHRTSALTTWSIGDKTEAFSCPL